MSTERHNRSGILPFRRINPCCVDQRKPFWWARSKLVSLEESLDGLEKEKRRMLRDHAGLAMSYRMWVTIHSDEDPFIAQCLHQGSLVLFDHHVCYFKPGGGRPKPNKMGRITHSRTLCFVNQVVLVVSPAGLKVDSINYVVGCNEMRRM